MDLNADGTFIYNPNGQFEYLKSGQTVTDSFTYTIGDGQGGTATATATVVIKGSNYLTFLPVTLSPQFYIPGSLTNLHRGDFDGNGIDDIFR